MINNSLIFLDTEIYVDDNGILQFKKYQKPSASDVILNFSKSITPKKYKISTLSGEIFRCNYTNTTDIEREKALKKLKIKFLKNNYPEKLINTKITEIKNREFKQSEFRAIREKISPIIQKSFLISAFRIQIIDVLKLRKISYVLLKI